jgi:threonine dehydrogenase-like Zn-dependent dehydrogenase
VRHLNVDHHGTEGSFLRGERIAGDTPYRTGDAWPFPIVAGFYGVHDQLALQPLHNRELSVDLVSGWSKERMDATLHLIAAGHLQTLPLITHHFPVAQATAAWQLIAAKQEAALGVILDW